MLNNYCCWIMMTTRQVQCMMIILTN
jgi:hypothetical protein